MTDKDLLIDIGILLTLIVVAFFMGGCGTVEIDFCKDHGGKAFEESYLLHCKDGNVFFMGKDE